jgi:hypothetical protein
MMISVTFGFPFRFSFSAPRSACPGLLFDLTALKKDKARAGANEPAHVTAALPKVTRHVRQLKRA